MSTQDEIDAKKFREWKNKTQKYNSEYYAQNKAVILAALLKKTKCIHCGTVVNHQQMTRHCRSTYCNNHRKPTGLQELKELAIRMKINVMMYDITKLHDATNAIYEKAQSFN
jgi:hypothetical protein